MPYLNKIQVIGNLGRDPQLRYFADGKATAKVSLAVTEQYGENKHTEWFECILYGKTAERVAQYMKKGGCLYLEGRLKTRQYTDKTGTLRSVQEVIVPDIHTAIQIINTQSKSADYQGDDEDIPDL